MSLTIHLILKSLIKHNCLLYSCFQINNLLLDILRHSGRVSVLIAVTRVVSVTVTVTAPKIVDDSTDKLEEVKLEDELNALTFCSKFTFI